MRKPTLFLAPVLLAFTSLALAHSPAFTSAPTAPTTRPLVRTYADGLADGDNYATGVEAQYGCNTADYNQQIDAAAAQAQYNATHSEEPTYWRGYRTGLVRHCN